jgi:hypothetical protein
MLLFYSCDKEEPQILNEPEQQTENDEYFVPLEEAQAIVSQVLFEKTSNGNQNQEDVTGKATKKINKSKSFPDRKGKAAGHIINFDEGGWVIISADKRTEALLAFSDESEFETALDNVPPGPSGWLSMVSEGISYIRDGKLKSDEKEPNYEGSWEISEIENALADHKSQLFSKNVETTATDCYYPGYPPGGTSICQDDFVMRYPLGPNHSRLNCF